MSFEKDIQLIEEYLAGKMQDGDRVMFEKRLSEEEDLQGMLAEMRALGQVTREEVLKDKLVLLQGLEERSSARRLLLKPWMSIAASILLLIAAFFWWQDYQEDQRIDGIMAMYEHYPSDVLTRGPSEERMKRNAYVLYEARKYQESLAYFETILILGNRSDSLYYGLALLGAREFEKASQVLSELSEEATTNMVVVKSMTMIQRVIDDQ